MDKIGPYKILEVLHKGPRPLYRAEGPEGRLVAIKAVAVSGLSPEDRERFIREAETCRVLEHPNLIRVYDVGEADGMLYQSMELLEGADLDKVASSGRKFSWEQKLSIMQQVCAGLACAHDRKLIHRDVKPANLFLENSGQVKVLDFGMVRVANSNLTRMGSALGTLNYMAPEQIQGNSCTPASDVFSAGIVFYQLASGKHPFSTSNQNLSELVNAIVFGSPPQLRAVCPDAPEGLELILEKALQKNPERRYENAGEFNHALGLCRALASQPVSNRPVGTPAAAADPAAAGGKTRIIRRPESPAVVGSQPMPPAVPPTPPRQAPAVPRAQARYCPICTQSVPVGLEICPHCGNRLTGVSEPTQNKTPKPWAFYVVLGIAVLLGIILAIVLMTK